VWRFVAKLPFVLLFNIGIGALKISGSLPALVRRLCSKPSTKSLVAYYHSPGGGAKLYEEQVSISLVMIGKVTISA
jgi:hypothetical protein